MKKVNKDENKELELKEYNIDYDMFSLEEIVKIVAFFDMIEKVNKGRKYKKDEVINKYNEYRNILNNKSLEKKYDKMLFDLCKVSIYHTMKDIINETR
ncbi:MAG: UPF0223 family protein [Bacilli bacterium]|nr:UPF0223 family protein [Bacilli bacterium]